MELCPMLCGSLDGRGVWGKVDTYGSAPSLFTWNYHNIVNCLYPQYFPCGSAGKESACNAGDLGSIPGLGRSPGEGKGYPIQYSGLENSVDCIVHGVAKSQTWQSDFHFHFPIQNKKWKKESHTIRPNLYVESKTKQNEKNLSLQIQRGLVVIRGRGWVGDLQKWVRRYKRPVAS